MGAPPGVEGRQGPFALQAVALFLVANFAADFFFEGLEQIEGDVGGLEVPGVSVGDVVDQRAEGGGARDRDRLFATGEGCRVEAGQHPCGNGFGVAFDAGDLAGEEQGGFGCADSLRMFLG